MDPRLDVLRNVDIWAHTRVIIARYVREQKVTVGEAHNARRQADALLKARLATSVAEGWVCDG
jgi:hypothetical protein